MPSCVQTMFLYLYNKKWKLLPPNDNAQLSREYTSRMSEVPNILSSSMDEVHVF